MLRLPSASSYTTRPGSPSASLHSALEVRPRFPIPRRLFSHAYSPKCATTVLHAAPQCIHPKGTCPGQYAYLPARVRAHGCSCRTCLHERYSVLTIPGYVGLAVVNILRVRGMLEETSFTLSILHEAHLPGRPQTNRFLSVPAVQLPLPIPAGRASPWPFPTTMDFQLSCTSLPPPNLSRREHISHHPSRPRTCPSLSPFWSCALTTVPTPMRMITARTKYRLRGNMIAA